jgi:hypothetical protein
MSHSGRKWAPCCAVHQKRALRNEILFLNIGSSFSCRPLEHSEHQKSGLREGDFGHFLKHNIYEE